MEVDVKVLIDYAFLGLYIQGTKIDKYLAEFSKIEWFLRQGLRKRQRVNFSVAAEGLLCKNK